MTLPMKKNNWPGMIRRVMVVQSAALAGSLRKPLLARRTYCGAKISARRTPAPRTTSMVVRMTESARSPPSSSPGFAVTVEHSDEGDGGGSADEEVGEQVWKGEGGAIGVLRDAGAEEGVDVLDADEGEEAGEHGREHEEERGGVGGVRRRGMEEGEGGAAFDGLRNGGVFDRVEERVGFVEGSHG